LRSRYEKHHRVRYTDEALVAAVHVSSRYIADRFLPDKAIDLIDEAGSKARIDAYMAAKENELRSGAPLDAASMEQMDQWRQLKEVRALKEERAREGFFEEASLLRTREMEVKRALIDNGVDSFDVDGLGPSIVDVDAVEHIASSWSGIPVQRMTTDEAVVLSNMDDALRSCVIGQDEAVNAVARSMRRARCGLKDPNRPIASMLFAGPTGVGKTELTKRLAERYFGSPDAMVRLDMSEYMERHSVSKLIGSPPGYVGFGQGGTLTEAVRRKPFTILLFDEIEKAHPDVFNVLLQMMEDGRLTDSQGRVVSFKNTLIVLTSNVGSKVIAKGGNTLGFSLDVDEDGEDTAAYKRMRDKVLDELKNFFRPEMLNRLDEIVCFKQLDEDHVARIAQLMLRETSARMREKGMELALTPAAMAKLLQIGFDKEYGARPLRRAITAVVDDNLSEALLRGNIREGDTAVVDYDPEYADGVGGYVAGASRDAAAFDQQTVLAGNLYLGVGVVGVIGDPCDSGIETAFNSFGADFEAPDEEIFNPSAVKGNVVSRPNVTNDVAA
jgi:ATP-dependent Clp protease ATP-binding subunit ClpC